jgi:hypothetical protein
MIKTTIAELRLSNGAQGLRETTAPNSNADNDALTASA